MITIRSGTYIHRLFEVLSVTGEYPYASLSLLGNERVIKQLVHQLERPQYIRTNRDSSPIYEKALSVSGNGSLKTIRLRRPTLPLLHTIHPFALDYYLNIYHHRFTGDTFHIQRNHRVAEAVAMLSSIGVNCRPYDLPPLMRNGRSNLPLGKQFYLARNIKQGGEGRSSPPF